MTGKIKNERKKKKQQNILFRILFLLALAVFLYAAVRLILYGITYWKGSHEYKGLQKYVSEQPKDEISTEENGEFTADKIRESFGISWENLRKINPEVAAWITIPGADISYPVVQGIDDEYYLKHTFEGQAVTAASIFMDANNHADFSDQNTFIYGHNMKDKTMFGKLNNYKDEEFYKENPYFYIYTPDYTYRYDIFSCYLARVDNEVDFYTQFASDEQFQEFLDSVKAQSAYDTGVEVTPEDKVITLMTCNKAGYDYRFLVHAVQTEAVPNGDVAPAEENAGTESEAE